MLKIYRDLKIKNSHNQRMQTGGRYDKRKVRHGEDTEEDLSKTTTQYYLPTMFKGKEL